MAGSFYSIFSMPRICDPGTDWAKPIEQNATFPITLEQLAFLDDTHSRRELLVFAQANPSRLPLTMGILQPDIPVRRMASEHKTKLNDALVRILPPFPDTSDSNLTRPSCLDYCNMRSPSYLWQLVSAMSMRGGLMLPSSSRVSPITYHSVVAVRYPDLC